MTRRVNSQWQSSVRVSTSFFILAFVLTMAAPLLAHADFITALSASDTQLGNGQYQYTYTITNSSQSTINAYSFVLATDSSANLQSLTVPTDWEMLYTTGSTSVEWDTAFQPVAPGGFAIFSFSSPDPPGTNIYQATGFDPDTLQFYNIGGTTISPQSATVPEPTSMIPLGTGLVTLVGYTLYRRLSFSE